MYSLQMYSHEVGLKKCLEIAASINIDVSNWFESDIRATFNDKAVEALNAERKELSDVVKRLEDILPRTATEGIVYDLEYDRRLGILLQKEVSIDVLGFKFTTAPSVELIECFIRSAKNDLYSWDVCNCGVDEADRLQPDFQPIY